MTQINNYEKYNNYQSQQTPIAGQQVVAQQVKIPNYYYTPDSFEPKGFKEALKENPLYDMGLKQIIESPLSVLATWLGLSIGIDAYAEACGGDYEKSLVKKAANLGDRIQNSKFIQSKPMKTVLGGISSAGKYSAKTAQKSAILRAMKNTPSMPEWAMVKSQMFNQKQEVVQDFIKIAEALELNTTKTPALKNLGLAQYEKEMLKKDYGVTKLTEIPQEELVNRVLLERLGKTPAEIQKIQALGEGSTAAVKSEILKAMGLDAKKINLIKEDVYGKYITDVENATKNVRGKVRIGAGHFNWLGPLTKPFERTIGCDEIYNKLHSMSGGAKTATGRFMSKAMQMFHRGITFGGGKLGALAFIAPILVEVGHNIKKADNDQKIGTAVGGVIENISWVFTFPLALKMLHSIGGAQYAGMSKENVEKYRKILNKFNEDNKAGLFKTKEEYKTAKKATKAELDKLSKIKGQNILTRGVRKLARFLTLDLETFKGYKGQNIVMNQVRKIPNFFKNVVGVPMRLGIWGAISIGVLDAALKKGTSMIFGKSYDAVKQDEHLEEKKKQKEFLKNDLNERLYKRASELQKNNPTTTPQLAKQGQEIVSRGKDINSNKIPTVVKEQGVDNYTYIPSSQNIIPHKKNSGKQDTYTYIPSSECIIQPDAKATEKQRKYIPSQAAANISKSFDNSGLQSALDRAQRAEDMALRVLAGNFE